MDSRGFEIRVIDDEKGKGLFATRPFEEGEIILEEKPIVCCQFSWNSEYYSACHNCLRPLETAEENAQRLTDDWKLTLPHPECCTTKKELITECPDCGVKYCSAECRDEAYQRYHRILCIQSREKIDSHPLVKLNEIWKHMHYPQETGTIMLLARMVALVNLAENKDEVLSTFAQFCNRTVNDKHEIVHKLLGEDFVEQIDLLREMMLKTLSTEYTSHWFTPEGFRGLLALVSTNGQGIGTSPFSCWVKNVSTMEMPENERIEVDKFITRIYEEMEDVVGSFLNSEGSGLYVLQSAVNHSCIPNAFAQFPYSNYILVLRASRNIQPGEEICISYLDECILERSRHSRQKALTSSYLFICRCDRCLAQADDPDETSEDEDDLED